MGETVPIRQSSEPPERLFTFDESLNLLRVSRRVLQHLVSNGGIAVVRIGRRVLFRPSDIDAFIEASRDAGATQ